MNKLTEFFTFRIPEVTKAKLEKLPPHVKRKLNTILLLAIDRFLHDAAYVPGAYLKSGPL